MAPWTKGLSQVLIHWNDQPVGPAAPYARWEIPAEAPDPVKVWRWWEAISRITPWINVLQRNIEPHPSWKSITYGICNGMSHPDGCLLGTPGGGNYSASTGPLCPLRAGPVETHSNRNEHAPLRGEGGVLVGLILPPVHLLTPDSAASPRCMGSTARSGA